MPETSLRVIRMDTGQVVEGLGLADLRWWLDTGHLDCAFSVTRKEPLQGDVAYLREEPGSGWCVRVKVLPVLAIVPNPESVLASAFRSFLSPSHGGAA